MSGICQLLEETGDCLSVTRGRMAIDCRVCVCVLCSLKLSVSYIRQVCSCLQGVCVLSYLREVSGCLLWCTLSITCGNLVVACSGCTLSGSSGGMTVICQLHEACWRLSVSYMRHDSDCLHGICNLSAT